MSTENPGIKGSLKFVLLLFILLALAISVFSIVKGSAILSPKEEEELIFSYVVSMDSSYVVYLKDNSYIDEEFLGENETYIAELVDYIAIDLDYSFVGNNKITKEYTYDIYAILTIEYRPGEATNNRLWHKKYPIKLDQSFKSSGERAEIAESINVQYHTFNQQALLFHQQLQLPILAYFDVYFEVSFAGEYQNEKITETQVYKINVPVNRTAFSIEKDEQVSEKIDVFKTIEIEVEPDIELTQIGFLLLVCTVAFIVLFNKIFDLNQKSDYMITRDKILKEFGEIIIEIVTPVNKEGLSVIEVKNFNEMTDLESELSIPIMFYEQPDREKGEFSIVYNNIIYIFEI